MFALFLPVASLVSCFHENYANDPLTSDDLIPPADLGRANDEGGPSGGVFTTNDLEGAGSNSPRPSEPLFEGDINMREKTPSDYVPRINQKRGLDGGANGLRKQFNAEISVKFRWPDGILPYVLQWDRAINKHRRYRIALAFKEIEDKTCIRFVPKEAHHNSYIRIANVDGTCWSSVGRMGGQQNISLNDACLTKQGTIIHEIMHALGFFHEQSRADRDSYVKIFPANIMDGEEGSFKSLDLNQITHLGMPYDYGSVLHYPPTAFSKNGEPTILPIPNDNVEIGQRRNMSEIDAKKINKLYNCPPKDTDQVDKTGQAKFVTQTPGYTGRAEIITQTPRHTGHGKIVTQTPGYTGNAKIVTQTPGITPHARVVTEKPVVLTLRSRARIVTKKRVLTFHGRIVTKKPVLTLHARIVTKKPVLTLHARIVTKKPVLTLHARIVTKKPVLTLHARIVTKKPGLTPYARGAPVIPGYAKTIRDSPPTPKYYGRDPARVVDNRETPVVTASKTRSRSNLDYSCNRNERCPHPDRVRQDRLCTVAMNRTCGHACSTSAFCKLLASHGQCALMTKQQEMRTFCGCACQKELANT